MTRFEWFFSVLGCVAAVAIVTLVVYCVVSIITGHPPGGGTTVTICTGKGC